MSLLQGKASISRLIAIAFATILCTAQSVNAAQVFLYGVVVSSNVAGSSFIGKLWTLDAVYTPAPGAATALLTAATFKLGNETWNVLTANNLLSVPPVVSGLTMVTPTQLQISANFDPASVPGNRGTGRSSFSLSINGTPADNSGFASQANIEAILSSSALPQQGSYAIIESSFATENLTLQRTVPEPSSWAIMVGVVGMGVRQALKRRAAKRQA
ncbi:MAG: hypothetical protein ACKO3T_05030 [Planctomycetaceae bacterium]